MRIVNLTPHNVAIIGTDGEMLEVPPSGQVARCTEQREDLGTIEVMGRQVAVSRAQYGAVENLPEPQADTIYVVSAIVLNAVGQERADVFCPGPAVRDEQGRIIACAGLSAGAAYVPPASPETPTPPGPPTPLATPPETPTETPTVTETLTPQEPSTEAPTEAPTGTPTEWETATEEIRRPSHLGYWEFLVWLDGCERLIPAPQVVRGQAKILSWESAIIGPGQKLYYVGDGDNAELVAGDAHLRTLLRVDLQDDRFATLLEIEPGDIIARCQSEFYRVGQDGSLAPVVGVDKEQMLAAGE